jgi:thioredoxin 1
MADVTRAGHEPRKRPHTIRKEHGEVAATRAVTDDSFEADVLKNPKPVLVDYWAEWCGPCKMVAPVLDSIAEEHGDKLDIVKLNVDENPEVTRKYGILNIPTLGVFQNGEVVKELVGARSKSALLRELAEFL